MKRYKIWFVLLLSLAFGCGNSQNADGEKQTENVTHVETQKQEETQEQEEMSEQNRKGELVYTADYVGNIDEIAVTEDGHLYVISLQEFKKFYKEGKDRLTIEQPSQWLYEFDANGKYLCVGQMILSPKEAFVLEWSDDCLYMVLPELNKKPVLYQVDNLSAVHKIQEEEDDMAGFSTSDIWRLKELYCFDMFSEITRLVIMGDRLYVYGMLANPNENPLVQDLEYAENYPDTYKGQVIGYMDMKNLDAGVTLLSMDGVPQDMIKFDENTLGIYLAEEDEVCFWKYIPAKEKWEKTDIAEVKYSEKAEESVVYGEFVAYENGCFYVKDGNVVCYKAGNGTEQELFESDGLVQCLETDGTFLYYSSKEWTTKEVRRIQISGLLKQ